MTGTGKKHLSVALLLSLACLAICLVSYMPSQAQTTTASTPRVAVCNVVDVLAQYQRVKDMTAMFDERLGALEAENTRRLKALEQLQTELSGYQPDSDPYNTTLRKWQEQTIQHRVWKEMEEQLILKERVRVMEEMYSDIKQAIRDVAEAQGIDLVLQRSPEQIEAKSATELVSQIDRRKVLYNTDALDISPAVLQRLNENYRVNKPR